PRDTAVPLEHGREIPHAEIALVLISDQDHLGMAAPAHRLIRCGGIALARRGHIHRRSLQELGGLGRSVRNDATDLGMGLEPLGQQLLAESWIVLEHVLHVDRVEDRTRPPQDQCLQCSELCRAQGRTCRWLGHSYLPMKWRSTDCERRYVRGGMKQPKMARANPRVNDLTTQVSRRWIGAGGAGPGFFISLRALT